MRVTARVASDRRAPTNGKLLRGHKANIRMLLAVSAEDSQKSCQPQLEAANMKILLLESMANSIAAF
jgi:hypothetical protein